MYETDIASDFSSFTDLVMTEVLPSLSEFGFEVHEAQLLMPGMWVKLRNRTTELTCYFEYDAYLATTIHRINADTGKYFGQNFTLQDLLSIRAQESERVATVEAFEVSQLKAALKQRASLLRQHGQDVLRGDFTVYEALKCRLEERRERARRRSEELP